MSEPFGIKAGAWLWTAIFFLVLIWSAIHPKDYVTWLLEVVPALIGFAILAVTYPRFRFTSLIYILILGHSVILMVGGHYTYAEVPAFDWLRDQFDMARNNYDKLGHFAQGFVPAMIAREILIRLDVINRKKWMNFLIVSICLAISAFYELIEWWVSLLSAEAAESFLGTQGYVWDTQSRYGTGVGWSRARAYHAARISRPPIGPAAEEKRLNQNIRPTRGRFPLSAAL